MGSPGRLLAGCETDVVNEPASQHSPVLEAVDRVRAAIPVATGDLLLRPLTRDDVDAVLAYRSRPEVAAYLSHEPLDRPAAELLVDRWLDDRASVSMALVVEGRLVGDVRLMVRPASAKAPARTREVEGWLGYAVHPDLQGRGLATAAVRAVVDLAFDVGGLRRITTRVFAPAVASARVMAKAGFTLEGTERAAVLSPDGSTWWDDQAWSLLAGERPR